MYISKDAVWSDTIYRPYEIENAYYIEYNIQKAIYSINKIERQNINKKELKDICFYNHVYMDLILESVGQISSRFYVDRKKSEKYNNKIANFYSKIIEMNKQSYDFSNKKYPILSNRIFRNFVTHINENNFDSIRKKNYISGFNVVFCGLPKKEKDIYLNEKICNNTLNLIDKKYYIRRHNDAKYLELDLIELKNELCELNKRNELILSFLKEFI